MTITTKTAKSYKEAMELVKEFHARRPDCYFVYDSENYGESRKNNTIYRFFDGMGKDGWSICFAMIEIIVNGKLDTVRVINTFRDTAVDIKIEVEVIEETDGSEDDADEEFTFNVTPAEDNDDDDELVDVPEVATQYTPQTTWENPHDFSEDGNLKCSSVRRYPIPGVKIRVDDETGDVYATQMLGEEEIITRNGKLHHVWNERLGAGYSAYPTPHFSFKVPDGKWHKFKGYTPDDPQVIDILLERAGSPEPIQPIDNFAAELANLKAAADTAKNRVEQKEQELLQAQLVHDKAVDTFWKFGLAKANQLHKELLPPAGFSKRITVVTQDGQVISKCDLSKITIDFSYHTAEFFITADWNSLGFYDTPEQVATVIQNLKAAIERDKGFTFPTVSRLTTPAGDPTELELIRARMCELETKRAEILDAVRAEGKLPRHRLDYFNAQIESLNIEYYELSDKQSAIRRQKGVA